MRFAIGRRPGYFTAPARPGRLGGANPLSDIFQEVDEDLRRDRLLKLWRRYGSFIIGGAIAIVIATAAYVAWQNYRAKQLMAEGDSFVQALLLRNAGQSRQAAEAFASLAERYHDGYGTLARFDEAALLAERGETADAVKIYDQLALSAPDRTFRDLAALCSVSLSLDTADPADLKTKLDPIAAPDNPLRHSARELSALLALRNGDAVTAKELFKELAADQTAPSGVRSRAEEMLQSLG